MSIELMAALGQFVAYVVIATIFVVMIKADVRILKVEMKEISTNIALLNGSFNRMGEILTKVAVQDTRIGGLEEDIREIKHGRGFVVDGEYSQRGRMK